MQEQGHQDDRLRDAPEVFCGRFLPHFPMVSLDALRDLSRRRENDPSGAARHGFPPTQAEKTDVAEGAEHPAGASIPMACAASSTRKMPRSSQILRTRSTSDGIPNRWVDTMQRVSLSARRSSWA